MGKGLKNIFNLLFLFLYLVNLNGQNQNQFKHLGIDQGLSNGRVTGIVQDSIGFIWIATKNGLNRFDGSNFKVFNKKNSTISSDDISVLTIDRKGRFWIGTVGGGINLYNPVKDEFSNFKNNPQNNNSITSDIIHTIVEDRDGNIWIGTENGLNLYVEKTKSFKSYIHSSNNAHSISHNSVWSIFEQKNGDFWVGTYDGGLNKFNRNNETFLRYSSLVKHEKNCSFDFINTVLQISQNELLIGTNGNGLIKFNTEDRTLSNFLKGTKFEQVSIIRTIWQDKLKNIWVGTDGQGVLKIQNKENNKIFIENYVNDSRLQSSLVNNTVNTIFQDNQFNIWIGTAWKGVNILKKRTNNLSLYYSDGKGYDSSPILSVFKNGNNLWMGTDGKGFSIYNLKNSKIKFYNKKSNTSVGGEFIQCIKQRKDKQYWLGTFANGLILFDSKKGKINQYRREPNNNFSLPYDDVRDILELDSGDLWVGTWGGGLSFFDIKKQQFNNFRYRKNNLNSISSNNVLSILKGENDKLWIATFGGGLNLFDTKTKKFSHFKTDHTNPKAIGSNYIFSLIKDVHQNLWLGTKEGLFKFDIKKKEFEKFIVGNTDNSNTIVGLLQDNNEHIWISTQEGIFRYDFITKKIESFPEITGEFHINSAYKDSEGILYFGGVEGGISFNPKSYNRNDNFPKIILTDFKLYNKSIDVSNDNILKSHISYQEDIILNYDQTVFTFDFAALEYPFSSKTHFGVKMEGFEKEWREIGVQQSTTYTNLSHGEYIFKVKSQTRNGRWNEKVAAVNIKILPPPWKTWWAYIIYSLIFLMMLLAARRYTLQWAEMKNKLEIEKYQREQEDNLHQIKQRFFTNISHEIRTPLTLILGPLNNLLRQGDFKASEQKQLSTIKNSTNRLLNLVNELLNFRKLETGHVKLKVSESNIVEFVNEIYLSYSQQAINKDIDYKFETPKESILVWFDKIQLEKAIYNLLSNAFKFSDQGGTINVKIKQGEKYVNIIISDSGKGIPEGKLSNIFDRFYQNENIFPKNKGFGIGLSITKDIVELHSGIINVKSTLNKGSDFSVKIPLGQSHFKADEIATEIKDEENIKNYNSIITDFKNEEVELKEDFSGATILLVEDNIHIREYLKNLLSEMYVIFEASNGKKGLEKAIDIVPDIVISDIMMPEMDGISFCHQLKTDIRVSHIPVILLTARTLNNDIIEGYETGADDYITKPFNETILKIRIKNLLQNRKMLRDRFYKEGILNPKEIALNSPDEEFLTKLVNIIEDNIEESEFNIDQLSKDIGMSHSNVYKKIKALTGMTIVGFIRDFRLKRAAQLLIQNKISIIDVCFKVGYTDRRHFSQEFKKKFGQNPTVYAKENLID